MPDQSKSQVHGIDDLSQLGLLSGNSLIFAKYWNSLPKKDLIPFRASFDPAAHKKIISNFVILELVPPEMVRFRLAGTAEVERYGQDITGRNYLDFVEPHRRRKAYEALAAIAGRPCGMLALIHSTSRSGKSLTNEAFGLPMRNDDGVANLLYFQSNTVKPTEFHDPWADRLQIHNKVSRRVFINIGAGLPAFED